MNFSFLILAFTKQQVKALKNHGKKFRSKLAVSLSVIVQFLFCSYRQNPQHRNEYKHTEPPGKFCTTGNLMLRIIYLSKLSYAL